MVNKLKDNISYIKYIREKIKECFPDWKECGDTVYEGQINNNFQIKYIGNIKGFVDSIYTVSFVKEREILELRVEDRNNNPVGLGYLVYNFILEKMPNQDLKWGFPLCTELIDFYIHFLQKYFIKSKVENI